MVDSLDQSLPLLQEILNSLSQSTDPPQSSVSQLISFLNSTLDATLSDPDNKDAKANASRALTKVHQFVSSPSLDQAIIKALSFELPMAVWKFGGISDGCLEVAESTIDCFISMCSPRDMLSILCEALVHPSETIRDSGYIAPLLTGLSKVFLSLQRRHFEQVKVAVPIMVKVLKTQSLELEDEDPEFKDLFDRALAIAHSIRSVCVKLEGVANEKLRALLGLYVLQIMAIVSMNHNVTSSQLFVLQLSSFFAFCGLSYLGVITGSDVDKRTRAVVGVIWGHASDDVVRAAEGDLTSVKHEPKNNQTERWQAVGMLKHILAPASLPWELKRYTLNFLICITDGNISHYDERKDFSSFMTSLFAALQAVQMAIMYASDTTLRKNAFEAFKGILADIPASQRFDMLEVFDHKYVLELVELILKPPEGGPPSFPEDTDKVKPTTLECCPEAIYRNPIRPGMITSFHLNSLKISSNSEPT